MTTPAPHTAPLLSAQVEGIGFWSSGLPSWEAALAFAATGALPEQVPARPSPQLLAPNERRRAPETVVAALEVALAACAAAGRDPASLASVFASTHGELGITDYMCRTLATEPASISPIRFHNSVHNAAAGYWTIGVGATRPATALSAYDASFAQGLLEALVQVREGGDAVLLVAYDGNSTGPLAAVSRSRGLLGGALVLSAQPRPGAPRLEAALLPRNGEQAPAHDPRGPLHRHNAGNAMAPMLPLFDAIATGQDSIWLDAGPTQTLRIRIFHD